MDKPQKGAAATPGSRRPPKKPYKRPVLYVIGKIGQIVSNN
jgi:hypothetical protein